MAMQAIFLPGLALVALTFAVVGAMYWRRIGQMRRERIHPQAVATSAQAAQRLTDSAAADNLRNLFELPVLFYFGLVVAALAGQGSISLLALAWAFVALRVAHTVIHCSYNKVMHRFVVFLFGSIVLLLFWIRLGWGLLAA